MKQVFRANSLLGKLRLSPTYLYDHAAVVLVVLTFMCHFFSSFDPGSSYGVGHDMVRPDDMHVLASSRISSLICL